MKKHIFCKEIKIADIGCGFGDFFEFLEEKKDLNYFYKGYDINPLMISYCKKKFNSKLFELSDEPKEICDYSIISGTYNYAIYDDIDLWERYLIFNLKKCLKKSSKGIIFNLQISSKSKIVNNIYYAGYDSIGKILNSNFNIKVSHIDKITPNDVYYVLLN